VSFDHLIESATAGDESAWKELWDQVEDYLEPLVVELLGPRGHRVGDRRYVIAQVMERLRGDGMQRLRLFSEMRRANPQLEIKAWLAVLARRVCLETMRSTTPARQPSHDADEVMRRAVGVVPEPDLSALELWTQGARFDEIARELDLDVAHAERMVRSALDRVRQTLDVVAVLLRERSLAEHARKRRAECAQFEMMLAIGTAAQILDQHLIGCAECRAIRR
jgi:DNA-directed RNA polymerase specialized sigma24 family protein